jgi:hypothetical protein
MPAGLNARQAVFPGAGFTLVLKLGSARFPRIRRSEVLESAEAA